MRRGIGVAHIQQQRQTQQKMADLGAQITATRVGQIADELETLEQQLRLLAQKHKSEIKYDPVVRARFRQLADSLGVDLISSKKNVFADTLGLGDFYYGLAGKVVEACMRERKFCGAYVPLTRVVAVVQKAYDSAVDASETHRTVISVEDVVASLKKLDCLGEGYSVVTLGGVRYIQTTPDGTKGGDQTVLLNHVLKLQKEKIVAAQRTVDSPSASRATSMPSSQRTPAPSSQAPNRSAIGAAYVLGNAHPADEAADAQVKAATDVPFTARVVSATASELATALGWPLHRCTAILKRLVQEGSVWVDYPEGNVVVASSTHEQQRSGRSAQTKGSGGFSATEVKEVWHRRASKKATATEATREASAVYWFVSIGGGDAVTG